MSLRPLAPEASASASSATSAVEILPDRNEHYSIRSIQSFSPVNIIIFWNDATVATTATLRANHDDLHLEWSGRYAAAAEVNWTNQK